MIDELYSELNALRVTQTDFFFKLRRWSSYDQPRAHALGLSAKHIDECLSVAAEVLFSLQPSSPDEEPNIALIGKEHELRTAIQAINSQLVSANNRLAGNWRETTVLTDADGSFHLSLDEPGAGRYADANINTEIRQLATLVPTLIGSIGQILPLCKPGAGGDLSARAVAFERLVVEVDKHYRDARSDGRRVKAAADRAQEHEKAVHDALEKATVHLARIRELATTANTEAGQITTQTQAVKEIHATAEKLEATVQQFQAKFDAYHESIDERLKTLKQFDADVLVLKNENNGYQTEIKRLIDEAKQMLSTSTTAGLAASLEDARKRYARRMLGTAIGFLISIAFLLVCAVPLASELVPGLKEFLYKWFETQAQMQITMPQQSDRISNEQIYVVIGKILLLLPASWLTAFMTKTFASLFQLEREYAQKAALARAVHGFQLQAPEYKEEITAEVFMEIRRNPAHSPSVDEAAHPLYDILAKVVGKTLGGKKEAKTAAEGQ